MKLLQLRNVTKELEGRTILKRISFSVESGEFVGITGKNGSGKTTLLKIMAGISRPTSGEVLIFGNPFTIGNRSKLGVVLEPSLLYGELSAYENLIHYSKLYFVKDFIKRTHEVLEQVELTRFSHQIVKNFSKGMKQRLSIARALLHRPELLLLDEPFDGLDTHSSQQIKEMLRLFVANGNGILMVSHDFSSIEQLCTRKVELNAGKIATLEVLNSGAIL